MYENMEWQRKFDSNISMKDNSKNNNKQEPVKDALLEMKSLESSMKQTTTDAVKALLHEKVAEEFNRLLSEADDTDYDETDLDQTQDNAPADNDTPTPEDNINEPSMDNGEEGNLDTIDNDTEPSDDDAWAEYEDYKTDDNVYDLRDADQDTCYKVFKMLDNDQQVVVVSDDDGSIQIKDNETGAEYIVKKDDNAEAPIEDTPEDDGIAEFDDTDDQGEDTPVGDDMPADTDSDDLDVNLDDTEGGDEDNTEDESDDDTEDDDNFKQESEEGDDDDTIFEIALNDEEGEVNEDLGYTTDYQKKTAMTTPPNSEPAKASSTYSMDKGVPTGTEKPYGKSKGDPQPFDKSIKENDGENPEGEEEQVEEATNVGGFVQQNSTSKSHIPDANGRGARNASKAGKHTGTEVPRYTEAQMENIKRKAESIFNENKQIKATLNEIKNKLYQAAVTNKNLGQIIKLITENTTTAQEKKDIIYRFGKEANTIEKSDKLYNIISEELKKVEHINNPDKNFNRIVNENVDKNNNIINQSVYKSKDLLESINLMNRMRKL